MISDGAADSRTALMPKWARWTSNLSRRLFATILLAGLPLVLANGEERETVSTLTAKLANVPLDPSVFFFPGESAVGSENHTGVGECLRAEGAETGKAVDRPHAVTPRCQVRPLF